MGEERRASELYSSFPWPARMRNIPRVSLCALRVWSSYEASEVGFYVSARLFILLSVIRHVWTHTHTHRRTKESVWDVCFFLEKKTLSTLIDVRCAPGPIPCPAFDYLEFPFDFSSAGQVLEPLRGVPLFSSCVLHSTTVMTNPRGPVSADRVCLASPITLPGSLWRIGLSTHILVKYANQQWR